MQKAKRELAELFARTVIRVNQAFRQFTQVKLKEMGLDLTFEMLQVLGCLWQKDGINQQEIADLTMKDKASMTYLIDNLSRRHLLYRQEDANDRRNKLIFLTDEGKALRQQIQPWVEEMYIRAGENTPMETLQECIRQMEIIRDSLSSMK